MDRRHLVYRLLLNVAGRFSADNPRTARLYVPKEQALAELCSITKQDFGEDVAAWKDWIDEHVPTGVTTEKVPREKAARRFLTERDRATSKRAARPTFSCEVALSREVALPVGHLEVWSDSDCVPPQSVPYYVAPDGAFFRTDASWTAFERMLAAGQVDLGDAALIELLVHFAPGHRVVTKESWVPHHRRDQSWAPRRLQDGSWVAYCNELTEGRWERIRIRPSHATTIEYVCPGPTFRRR